MFVIPAIWLTSFALMLPIALARTLHDVALTETEVVHFCTESWDTDRSRQQYDSALVILMFIIPGILITVCYTLIGRALWTPADPAAASDESPERHQAVNSGVKKRRRIARLFAVVAAAFALCWLPYQCFSLYIVYAPGGADTHALDVLPFALLLGHFNSTLNPVLYFYMSKTFRDKLQKYIRCSSKLCPPSISL